MTKWHIRLERMIPFGTLERRLYVFRETDKNNIEVATITFRTLEASTSFNADTEVFLSSGMSVFEKDDEIHKFLCSITDFALDNGIRPSRDFSGELKATREHLEDMRRIGGVSDWKKT